MANILIVDDNEMNRNVLKEMIVTLGHNPVMAKNGFIAMVNIKKQPPDLVLLDILMPKMDGYEVLDRLKNNIRLSNIPVIMISAVDDIKSIVQCIEKGADDYLPKPFNPILLKARINACLDRYRFIKAERDFLEKTLRGSIKVLTDILSMTNPIAFGRASRLRNLAYKIGVQMKVKKIWELELAAMFSQLGCVTIPMKVLEKVFHGEPLLPEEEEIYAKHKKIGHDLIVNLPRLKKVAEIIASQDNLFSKEGANINDRGEITVPFGAQILKVAKDFDTLVLSGKQPIDAIDNIRSRAKHYNPVIVNALAAVVLVKPEQKTSSLKIDELQVGMILMGNIESTSGQIICPKGVEIDDVSLNRIKNFSLEMEIIEPIKVIVPSTDQR